MKRIDDLSLASVRVCSAILTSAVLLGCGASDVSGLYVQRDQSGATMFQIVETPDHHLTGQFTAVKIGADGVIQNLNGSIIGAADGPSITIGTKSNAVFSEGVEFSGSVNWRGQLELTGPVQNGQVLSAVLTRGTAAEFQTMVAEVRSESDAIVKARFVQQAAQHNLSALNQLISDMQRAESDEDKALHGAPIAEQRYRSITSKMKADLDRERSLAGNSKAYQARVDIAVRMINGPIASDQMHFQVESMNENFRTKISPTAQAVSRTAKACTTPPNVPYNGPLAADIASACKKVTNASAEFLQKYNTTYDTLTRLESVYQQELNVQKSLSDEAERLE